MLSQLTHCRSWESIDPVGSVQISCDAANVFLGFFFFFFFSFQKVNASRSVNL